MGEGAPEETREISGSLSTRVDDQPQRENIKVREGLALWVPSRKGKGTPPSR